MRDDLNAMVHVAYGHDVPENDCPLCVQDEMIAVANADLTPPARFPAGVKMAYGTYRHRCTRECFGI